MGRPLMAKGCPKSSHLETKGKVNPALSKTNDTRRFSTLAKT